jgi:hypothetical protein
VAFSNRVYVWEQLPLTLAGWRYTRTAGGEAAQIAVTPQRDMTLRMATAASGRGIDTRGWQAEQDLVFRYTDAGRTPMQVLSREAKAGQRIEIPQGNWTGGLLLIPPAEAL